jgi:hypothetical protein
VSTLTGASVGGANDDSESPDTGAVTEPACTDDELPPDDETAAALSPPEWVVVACDTDGCPAEPSTDTAVCDPTDTAACEDEAPADAYDEEEDGDESTETGPCEPDPPAWEAAANEPPDDEPTEPSGEAPADPPE